MATTSAFIFLPDISGFTEFVNKTETSHSQHIISELLELIMNANELNLAVSEVEGDAVLFYREGPPPALHELEHQAHHLFLVFHNYLRSYKSRRLCQCGACSTASNLTLKMVAHFGEIGYVKVRDFHKPHGRELILAHRLMKNNVESREYLLMSQGLLDHWELEGTAFDGETQSGTSSYDEIGKVSYKVSDLSPLHAKVQDLPPLPHHHAVSHPVQAEVFIQRPLDEVYEVVSNFDYREQWNEQIKGLQYDPNRINRVGTTHQCLVGGKLREFTTITKNAGPQKRVYGEHIDDPPLVQEFSVYYIMEPKEGGTLIREEMHITPHKGIKGLFTPLFRRALLKNIKSANQQLKMLLEGEAE